MEIENEDVKSVDSFKAEMDLVQLEEDEDENKPSQKERLAKMLERINPQNAEKKEENQDNNNPEGNLEGNNQVLRAAKPKAGQNKESTQKDKIPEPFDPNFNLNERYFYQNININEWNDITNFLEKFISDEKMGEKELEDFFEKHPKIAKGNVEKLQGSVADIFSKNKNVKKYKVLTKFLINKYYKPKPVICECYFFPNPSNEQRVVNMFRTCKKTLDIAIFTFTRDSIAQAILEAHQRGLKIRCIGDDGNSKVKGSDVRLLASVGIPCKTDNNFRFHMHNKMAIIDNSVVITGSFNWTNQAINKNQDNILFIEDKNIANQYTEYFNKIWNEFTTVITPEEAKKYIEDEKKEQEAKNKEKGKEKTTEKKGKTEKTDKKSSTSTKKEAKKETKKSASTSKEKTTKKEKSATAKTTKAGSSKEKTTKKETKKTTKAKTEKRSKTMKEIKKGSTAKGTKEKASKSKTNTKSKSSKTKTTKEKKKEKSEKAKSEATTKRVRGVKSTTKSAKKKK